MACSLFSPYIPCIMLDFVFIYLYTGSFLIKILLKELAETFKEYMGLISSIVQY